MTGVQTCALTILELDMEKRTGPKLGKEYVKAVCCHPDYLTYMQSTSLMKVKQESEKVDAQHSEN